MKTDTHPPAASATSRRAAYTLRLAQTAEDLQAAQRLRYKVFNVELGEGLAQSHATGLDEDAYDAYCDHLLVVQEATGAVVGTYRLQTGQLAAAHLGYYSEQEFDFAPFEPLRCELVELGRACVHRDHRHVAVLSLLWRGIALYAIQRKARYLIGCSSLTSQDPVLGATTYEFFRDRGYLAEPRFLTAPTPAFFCAMDETRDDCPPPPNCCAPTWRSARKSVARPRSTASSAPSTFSPCWISTLCPMPRRDTSAFPTMSFSSTSPATDASTSMGQPRSTTAELPEPFGVQIDSRGVFRAAARSVGLLGVLSAAAVHYGLTIPRVAKRDRLRKRAFWLHRWSRHCARAMGMRIKQHGDAPPPLLVASFPFRDRSVL